MEIDEGMDTLCGQMDMHGAETGNAAHLRVDRGLDQRRADGGIDYIPARAQDVQTGFHRLGCAALTMPRAILLSPGSIAG